MSHENDHILELSGTYRESNSQMLTLKRLNPIKLTANNDD